MKRFRPLKNEKSSSVDLASNEPSNQVKNPSSDNSAVDISPLEVVSNDFESAEQVSMNAFSADKDDQDSNQDDQSVEGDLRDLLERARRLDKVSSKISCAEIMLKSGLITQGQLKRVLERHGSAKDYFHQIIVDMKLLSREKVLETAAEGWNVDYIDLAKEEEIDPEVIRMIPESKALRSLCIPVYKTETKLSVAMADPLDIFVADDIKISLRATGLDFEIEPLLAFPKDIKQKLEETYGVTDAIVQEMLDGIEYDEVYVESAEQQDDDFDIARSLEDAQKGPIISLVNAILLEAVKQGATDIHIEPFGKRSLLRYRIDSRLREVPSIPLPRARHNAIVSRIKIMAQCDIGERRLPQDGTIPLTAVGRQYDLRISIIPTASGAESVVMRVLDRSSSDLSLDQLGFLPRNLRIFEEAIGRPHGLILVTGPTGSGKTTTLYSALNTVNTPEIKILTVENPVERKLEGAIQVQTKPEIELDFAIILKYFLRHDPDVIMVGEIRDKETAKTAVEAALTGHLVLSTLHTNDAPSCIIRLKELGINEFLLASSLQLAMAQRLVRKVCEKCKRPIPPTGSMLNVLRTCKIDTENLNLCEGVGCNFCSNMGLKGMTAIHELLYIDDDIKDLILKGDSSGPQIRRLAREKGMKTLREDGMEKVAKGITTYGEVILKTMDI